MLPQKRQDFAVVRARRDARLALPRLLSARRNVNELEAVHVQLGPSLVPTDVVDGAVVCDVLDIGPRAAILRLEDLLD